MQEKKPMAWIQFLSCFRCNFMNESFGVGLINVSYAMYVDSRIVAIVMANNAAFCLPSFSLFR